MLEHGDRTQEHRHGYRRDIRARIGQHHVAPFSRVTRHHLRDGHPSDSRGGNADAVRRRTAKTGSQIAELRVVQNSHQSDERDTVK